MYHTPEGHLLVTPRELYQRARKARTRLVNDVLIPGTPIVFETYRTFCDFLHAVAVRIGVAPRGLFLRGSCKIGFSIAPKATFWTRMKDASDLDLAVVDVDYFHRITAEVAEWEKANPVSDPQEAASQTQRDDFPRLVRLAKPI